MAYPRQTQTLAEAARILPLLPRPRPHRRCARAPAGHPRRGQPRHPPLPRRWRRLPVVDGFRVRRRAHSRFPHLVVMPDGGAGTYSRLASAAKSTIGRDSTPRRSPSSSRRTSPSTSPRRTQLLAGLSMGGYGAMKYAAWHPDRFGAAAAFSSPLDPLSTVPAFDIIAMREGARSMTLFGDPVPIAANGWRIPRMHWPRTSRGLDLWFSAGSGSLEGAKDRDLVEKMINAQGERFSARLNALGIRHSWFPRTSGLHNWTSWERELGAWLKTLARRRNYASSNRGHTDRVADGGRVHLPHRSCPLRHPRVARRDLPPSRTDRALRRASAPQGSP
jgi:pimeloyl-ACP methyl ester carboxylesterase